jgi:hypothetical protein
MPDIVLILRLNHFIRASTDSYGRHLRLADARLQADNLIYASVFAGCAIHASAVLLWAAE